MNVCMLALMIMTKSHSVPITAEPCVASGYTKAWNELLHPASIAKKDTRYGLHQGGPLNNLSPQEIEWISKVTGRVICPGSKGLKGSLGSGSLVGANDRILTASHVVRNKDGSARADWARCYFETQSVPPVRRKLKFFDDATIFGTRIPEKEQDLDFLSVRLDQPIPGVEPVSIAADVADVKKGSKVLVVSAFQSGLPPDRKINANEPVIQNCAAEDILPADQRSGIAINSNCSGTGGASGSVTMVRDFSGKLVGAGMLVRSGESVLDHQEYGSDPDKGSLF